ncbi:hypothetical protein DAPPUDRAFT_324096 [Daphnia pulex]|uniref:Uncharacterized protein n=1 Tax=Daphnia pulex TaxID=6669 RepID=E9H0P0_DAPPU|nr:hypothetical protein DAPPUDRAFT_324096 [Daphnia pulex]|eukprot:EFX74718.1 hypothetical protein DAPPUDRAFT_324096 [Daphnia pulex]
MADEAVNAYNINHPALKPMSVTHKVLRDVSSKFWKHEVLVRSAFQAIHKMERLDIDTLTVPHVNSILGTIEEKGKLIGINLLRSQYNIVIIDESYKDFEYFVSKQVLLNSNAAPCTPELSDSIAYDISTQ